MKMSKRGFLDLNDDNFWGNDDTKEEASSEQEENEEKEVENQSSEVKEVPAESHIEESGAVKKTELDGWEDVGGEIVKKSDVKAETGNPFRENSPFGGFSRTNAAVYYQEEQNKKSERHQRRRSHERNHGSTQVNAKNSTEGAIEYGNTSGVQAETPSRKDSNQMETSAIEKRSPPSTGRRSKERWVAKRDGDGEEKEAWERELISSSGSGSSVAEQSGDGPRVGWNNTERTDLNMIDEQYVEYYEYLCQGIQKLLESGITLNADCESRGSTTSFQQPTVCRALKSKYYRQYNLGPEIYSRKVFVGGLPIDIEEVGCLQYVHIQYSIHARTKFYFKVKVNFKIIKNKVTVRPYANRTELYIFCV
ncbi:hypothetical protein Y032_0082g1610 [Ancylostoma ceylanicum]|uniref:Uncharacterized protein n=1 Tax=Ancylostoma ceylanicum TaxID=53326 RepID=A0A016TSX0_9BILA|nr:hypothetical protein Y032_0082g1610 [Ancylostoma ceylanicum]